MPLYGRYSSRPIPGTLLDRAAPINRGLVLEWACNEGAGPGARDQAGVLAPAAGTIVNPQNPAWSDGIICGATTYCHSGVAVPGLPAAPTAAWAFECWIAATTLTANNSIPFGFGATVAPSPNALAGSNRALLVRAGPTVGFWSGSYDFTSAAPMFADGLPHQYLLTTPGGSATSPTISVYVDGVFRASGTPSGAANALAAAATGGLSEVWTGGFGTSGMVGRFLRGRIWNRALTADEVTAAYVRPWASYASPSSFLSKRSSVAATLVRRTLSDRAGSRGVA